MARVKQSIIQRDMSLMELREDFLERDDLELRAASLKTAYNMRPLATGAASARYGSLYRRTLDASSDKPIEIRPADGVTFGMILTDDEIQVFNEIGGIVHTETSVPWSSASDLWVVPLRDETLIGDPITGIKKLVYDDGGWSLDDWSFSTDVGNEVAQPYWVFDKGIALTPSARTGSITLTASSPIFTAEYVGLRIRYGNQEVEITGYVSSTILQGDVVSELPPTYRISVDDTSEFRVGEVVVGEDTNFQGVVASINSATRLDIITLTFFDGPDDGENLTGTNGSSEVGSYKVELSPGASSVWDEPMMSDVRGWPRSAASASGRLVFVDFPQIPDAIAVSSARDVSDFAVGAEDDDAIARQVGDDVPRFRHAVNAGDLLLLSDRGCYSVELRGGSPISPSTFNPVLFDKRGCSEVKPVQVNDGVVFVESNGQSIASALLDGNIYLKWSVKNLTEFHNQLIKSPVALCGPSLTSPEPEKFVFVVNGDGTLAAISYSASLSENGVGIAPWETDGSFVNVAPMFGGYWPIVDREIDGETVRMLEAFDEGTYLDCAVTPTSLSGFEPLTVNGVGLTVNGGDLTVGLPIARHLIGKTVTYMDGLYVHGDYTVNADGTVDDEPELYGSRQVGLNFTATASPWPVEVIESPRAGTFDARCIRFLVSMQGSGPFQVKCNSHTRELGGYDFGDDISEPPETITEHYAVPVFGRRQHADLAVIKHMPGPFRILYTGQEVQA